MAKNKVRKSAPKATAVSTSRPYGKWASYGVGAALVISIVSLMLRAPADIPEGIPDGTEVVVIADRSHVEGPIQYDRMPPAGGMHNPVPFPCGIYKEPVPFERVVHTLEHGAVWITYRPDIGSGDLRSLENASRVRYKTILSPLPGQSAPVIATAWGRQIVLQDTSDIRLRQFIQHFESARTAPEWRLNC